MGALFLKSGTQKALSDLRRKKNKLNVVITGGTKGLGRAMVREFVNHGDSVFVVSRTESDVVNVIQEYKVRGRAVDVGIPAHVALMFKDIDDAFDGNVDLFLNCAGQSGGNREMMALSDQTIENIVQTNLLGTAMCCKYAYALMSRRETGGSIFNFAGAGSDGQSTENYSLYGASKAGINQLTKTLQNEWQNTVVDVHLVSPGMLMTDLLLENMEEGTYDAIKAFVSEPDIVAAHVVPRIRNTYYYVQENNYIKFLTLFKIAYKLLSQGAS